MFRSQITNPPDSSVSPSSARSRDGCAITPRRETYRKDGDRVVELPIICKIGIQKRIVENPQVVVVDKVQDKVKIEEVIKEIPRVTVIDRVKVIPVPHVKFIPRTVFVPKYVVEEVKVYKEENKPISINASTCTKEPACEHDTSMALDTLRIPGNDNTFTGSIASRDSRAQEYYSHLQRGLAFNCVSHNKERLDTLPLLIDPERHPHGRPPKIRTRCHSPCPLALHLPPPGSKTPTTITVCVRPFNTVNPLVLVQNNRIINVDVEVPGPIVHFPFHVEVPRERVVPKYVPGEVVQKVVPVKIEKIIPVPVPQVDKIEIVQKEEKFFKEYVRHVDVEETVEEVVDVPVYTYIEAPRTIITPRYETKYYNLPPVRDRKEQIHTAGGLHEEPLKTLRSLTVSTVPDDDEQGNQARTTDVCPSAMMHGDSDDDRRHGFNFHNSSTNLISPLHSQSSSSNAYASRVERCSVNPDHNTVPYSDSFFIHEVKNIRGSQTYRDTSQRFSPHTPAHLWDRARDLLKEKKCSECTTE